MTTASDITHEIETAYAGYNAAFHDEDVAGVVRYISAPYVATIGGGAPSVTETAERQL